MQYALWSRPLILGRLFSVAASFAFHLAFFPPLINLIQILSCNANSYAPTSGAEITPFKDPHIRIKGLALTNGHGRYITATPERTLVSVGEWPLHITVINL
jgi:hypothetical protein